MVPKIFPVKTHLNVFGPRHSFFLVWVCVGHSKHRFLLCILPYFTHTRLNNIFWIIPFPARIDFIWEICSLIYWGDAWLYPDKMMQISVVILQNGSFGCQNVKFDKQSESSSVQWLSVSPDPLRKTSPSWQNIFIFLFWNACMSVYMKILFWML